jgi:hypothetical protein
MHKSRRTDTRCTLCPIFCFVGILCSFIWSVLTFGGVTRLLNFSFGGAKFMRAEDRSPARHLADLLIKLTGTPPTQAATRSKAKAVLTGATVNNRTGLAGLRYIEGERGTDRCCIWCRRESMKHAASHSAESIEASGLIEAGTGKREPRLSESSPVLANFRQDCDGARTAAAITRPTQDWQARTRSVRSGVRLR